MGWGTPKPAENIRDPSNASARRAVFVSIRSMGENAANELRNTVNPVDVSERGAPRDGIPQTMDRRLFMQLTVFETDKTLAPADALKNLGLSLARRNVASVVYEDVNNPHGLGVLSWSEDPLDFANKLRP